MFLKVRIDLVLKNYLKLTSLFAIVAMTYFTSFTVLNAQCITAKRISSKEGGFQKELTGQAHFGQSMAEIGDLDGDGITDMVVSAPGENNGGGFERGAVYVLFMNADETIKAEQEISSGAGGLTSSIINEDNFGSTVANIGDLDGDGINEIAVSINNDAGQSSIIILFLNIDGTVSAEQRIGQGTGGFSGTVQLYDALGKGLTGLGDLDGDGIPDFAAGAWNVANPQDYKGGVYIFFMNANGTIKSQTLITEGTNGLNLVIPNNSFVGETLANLGDLDGDDVIDIAVSEPSKSGGGMQRGAVYIWFLNSDGTVKAEQEIGDNIGGFPSISDNEKFGSGLASAGDLDGDGVNDLLVGARNGDTGADFGRFYILLLNSDGTVKAHQEISNDEGDFSINIPPGTHFGASIANIGDIDNDGYTNFVIGSPRDYNIGPFEGVIYTVDISETDGLLHLQSECPGNIINQITSASTMACLEGELPEITNDIFDLESMPGSNTFDGPDIAVAQWQISYDNVTWEDIPNASALDLLVSIDFEQTTYIRRAYFGECCSIENYSNIITITQAGTSPEIASIQPIVYCPGAGGSEIIDIMVSGGSSPYTYSWTPSGGLSATNIEDPTVTFGVNDVYEVMVTGSDGCIAKKAAVMIPMQSDAGGSTAYICNDEGIQIGSNGIPGAVGVTYSWSPSTDLSCSDCPNPMANPSSTTTYTITIDDGNGCTNSSSIEVIPGAYQADAGDDVYVCRGDDVMIGTPEEVGIFYGWAPGLYIDNQTIAEPTFFSGVIPSPNPFTYTLTTFDPASGDCYSVDSLVAHVAFANAGIQEPFETVCESPIPIGVADCCNGLATYSWTILSGDGNSFYDPITETFSSTSSLPSPYVFPNSVTEYQVEVSWGPNADNSGGAICSDVGTIIPDCGMGCGISISFNNEVECGVGTAGTIINTDVDTAFSTITWTPTTNLSCTDCANPSLVADVLVDITYTVDIVSKIDGSPCSETFTIYNSATATPTPLVMDGLACLGIGVNIGNLPVVGWSYEWTPTSSLDDPTSSNPLASPNETTIYTLVTTDDITGCESDTTVAVSIFNMEGVTGGNEVVCTGSSTIIGSPAEPGLTYLWSPATDLSDPNIAQPTATVNNTITYSLLVTAANGCSFTEEIILTATNALDINTGDVNLCEGSTVNLFASIDDVNPNNISYSWTGVGLMNANTQYPTVSGIVTDQVYTVTASYNGSACGSAMANVTIVQPPMANLVDMNHCDAPLTLGPVFNFRNSYLWSPSLGLSNPFSANPMASPPNTTTYTLIITDVNNCTAEFTQTVTLDGPQVSAGSDLEICEGTSVSIGALPAEAGVVYSWSPALFLNDANEAQTIATPSVTTTYTLSGMKNGCTTTDELTITVIPKPNNVGNLDPSVVICENDCQIIGVENNSLYNYQWIPMAAVSTPNSSMTEVCPTENIELSLVVSDESTGCSFTQDMSVFLTSGGDCPACNINVTSAVASSCNSITKMYELSVTIDYVDGPGGSITVSTDNGQSESFMSTGISPETFVISGIVSSSTSNVNVSATFDDDSNCSDTLISAYNEPNCCPTNNCYGVQVVIEPNN